MSDKFSHSLFTFLPPSVFLLIFKRLSHPMKINTGGMSQRKDNQSFAKFITPYLSFIINLERHVQVDTITTR